MLHPVQLCNSQDEQGPMRPLQQPDDYLWEVNRNILLNISSCTNYLQVSADRRNFLHFSQATHVSKHSGGDSTEQFTFLSALSIVDNVTTILFLLSGQVWGQTELLVRHLHGLPRGVDSPAAVSQLLLLQGLLLSSVDQFISHLVKVWDGSQLILGTMYSYDIFAAVPCCAERLKVSVKLRKFFKIPHSLFSVQLLWPPGDSSRPEDKLLLGLQSDRVLPPVRRPGLPLREASEAQLPDQGGCQQGPELRGLRDLRADQPALMGQDHSKLLNGPQQSRV